MTGRRAKPGAGQKIKAVGEEPDTKRVSRDDYKLPPEIDAAFEVAVERDGATASLLVRQFAKAAALPHDAVIRAARQVFRLTLALSDIAGSDDFLWAQSSYENAPARARAEMAKVVRPIYRRGWGRDWRATFVMVAACQYAILTKRRPVETFSPSSFPAYVDALWSIVEGDDRVSAVSFTRTIREVARPSPAGISDDTESIVTDAFNYLRKIERRFS